MTMTLEQCKAARAIIGMSRERLAEVAKVSFRTITDFEGGKRTPLRATVIALRKALEDHGIVFIDENGGGAGVRLREPRK